MGEGTQQPQPVIHCNVEPAPPAWTRIQMLALAAILVLGGLKYLPAATHFCHRGRNWTSFDPSRHPADDLSHQVGGVDFVEKKVGGVDILSWISCLDLRALAVLTNSTMSSSSQPDDVSFSFLIPEGGNDQLPFNNIKSVLPDSNITVTSQKQIKDKLNVATPQGNFLWSFRNELPPIIIAETGFSRKRYVYISADSVVKGKVEDLVRIDLGSYAIGAAEDCSKRLGDYASMDVLNVVQRTHRGLVYAEPYDKDACLLDFDVVLVEPRNLKRNLIDSIKLWTMAVNLPNSRDAIRVAMTLAFYNNYVKLPTNWKCANESTDILYYDGPKNVCYESGHKHREKASGKAWQQYLSQKSEVGWDIPDVCDYNWININAQSRLQLAEIKITGQGQNDWCGQRGYSGAHNGYRGSNNGGYHGCNGCGCNHGRGRSENGGRGGYDYNHSYGQQQPRAYRVPPILGPLPGFQC